MRLLIVVVAVLFALLAVVDYSFGQWFQLSIGRPVQQVYVSGCAGGWQSQGCQGYQGCAGGWQSAGCSGAQWQSTYYQPAYHSRQTYYYSQPSYSYGGWGGGVSAGVGWGSSCGPWGCR